MKLIDLSMTLRNGAVNDPPGQRPTIVYTDHEDGRDNMLGFFPAATEEDLPDGLGWSYEGLFLGTHTGTHMDAPWHYHPTMSEGEPAMTIDQLPLEWCISNGVMLDFSDKEDGYKITAEDIKEKLDKIGHKLQDKDIVLIQSGAAPYANREEYMNKGCGMGREATNYLTKQGVAIVGTDAWSWDRPLSFIAKEFAETGDNSIIWEGHFAGIDQGYFQMEKLTNLDKLPPTGFKVICFPIKIKRASAGWVRAVALLDE